MADGGAPPLYGRQRRLVAALGGRALVALLLACSLLTSANTYSNSTGRPQPVSHSHIRTYPVQPRAAMCAALHGNWGRP